MDEVIKELQSQIQEMEKNHQFEEEHMSETIVGMQQQL